MSHLRLNVRVVVTSQTRVSNSHSYLNSFSGSSGCPDASDPSGQQIPGIEMLNIVGTHSSTTTVNTHSNCNGCKKFVSISNRKRVSSFKKGLSTSCLGCVKNKMKIEKYKKKIKIQRQTIARLTSYFKVMLRLLSCIRIT